MDHVSHEKFKNYILVHFANNRIARFDLVKDGVSGKEYLHPKGEYEDDKSECWISLPYDVYAEYEYDALHLRFAKN